eukprot:4114733-Amphidinium_carterae.1
MHERSDNPLNDSIWVGHVCLRSTGSKRLAKSSYSCAPLEKLNAICFDLYHSVSYTFVVMG